MMFSESTCPPTTESCTCNRGGLNDRLRSWKLQTKGNVGRNITQSLVFTPYHNSVPIMAQRTGSIQRYSLISLIPPVGSIFGKTHMLGMKLTSDVLEVAAVLLFKDKFSICSQNA
ncbi:hypothetical protein CHARACLAT_020251 [Characodon lateralis]|uniref:Uncharacterized protein n=1 Tax=Characodon lateralis TaxID=208331 RepID=A0ABU7EBA0_9TELE|nr:hypothetical protein [Characodon lateralis]